MGLAWRTGEGEWLRLHALCASGPQPARVRVSLSVCCCASAVSPPRAFAGDKINARKTLIASDQLRGVLWPPARSDAVATGPDNQPAPTTQRRAPD